MNKIQPSFALPLALNDAITSSIRNLILSFLLRCCCGYSYRC